MRDVILHAFDWHYQEITDRAAAIAALGYGAVLIPPPLYSDPAGSPWWQRYQPKDYRVLRSYLGGKAELQGAIAALHAQGVRVYADVVFTALGAASCMTTPWKCTASTLLSPSRRVRRSYGWRSLWRRVENHCDGSWPIRQEPVAQSLSRRGR